MSDTDNSYNPLNNGISAILDDSDNTPVNEPVETAIDTPTKPSISDIWDKAGTPQAIQTNTVPDSENSSINETLVSENIEQDSTTDSDDDLYDESAELVEGEIVELDDIPSDLITDDDTPDITIESEIDTEEAIHDKNTELHNATTTSEALELVGGGMKVGGRKLRIPHLPKTRGRKTGVVGCPVHVPTDAMRKYVFDAMCDGYTQGSVAHNLRIARMTLVKHYSYELQLAEDAKDTIVDGVLLRNACKSETDKGYQRSLEFYYKRHGKVKGESSKQIAGGDITNNNFIVVPTVINNQIAKGETDPDIPED